MATIIDFRTKKKWRGTTVKSRASLPGLLGDGGPGVQNGFCQIGDITDRIVTRLKAR